MHIAMITNNYKPTVGGVPISVERLSQGLRRRGHQVTIFAPHSPGAEPEQDVVRWRSKQRGLSDQFVIPALSDRDMNRFFQKNQIDLIHVHQPMIAGQIGLRLARRHGIPLAFTHHTQYSQYLHYLHPFTHASRSGRLYKAGQTVTDRFCTSFANRCSLVFAPTGSIARQLGTAGVYTPTAILPTGLERDDFLVDHTQAQALRRQYLPQGGHLMCTVSRLSQEKNQAFLLRAMARYKAEHTTPFHLLIIGDGPERTALTALTGQLGLTAHVTFVGEVAHDALPDWYGACDLFLFSSRSETQGIVLAEAMAAGLPVVAVSAPGVCDLVRDRINGRITPLDEEIFAQTVADTVCMKANLARMSQEALSSAHQYDAFHVAASAEYHYMQMIHATVAVPTRRLFAR